MLCAGSLSLSGVRRYASQNGHNANCRADDSSQGKFGETSHPPGFRVVASKPNFADIELTELAKDEANLLVIEAGEAPPAVIPHIARFKQDQPLGRIVLLQHHWRTADIAAAFEAGTNACFTENMDSHELLKAIELIMLGHQTMLPNEVVAELAGREHKVSTIGGGEPSIVSQIGNLVRQNLSLSPRETSILSCLSRGASNKLIAREINISEATVKVHVKAILRKIGVANRTQAAVWAMTNFHSSIAASLNSEGSPLAMPHSQN